MLSRTELACIVYCTNSLNQQLPAVKRSARYHDGIRLLWRDTIYGIRLMWLSGSRNCGRKRTEVGVRVDLGYDLGDSRDQLVPIPPGLFYK